MFCQKLSSAKQMFTCIEVVYRPAVSNGYGIGSGAKGPWNGTPKSPNGACRGSFLRR